MKQSISVRALAMGGMMGLMMLGMVHLMMTGAQSKGLLALAAFAGAHVAVIAILAGLGVFAAKLSPRLSRAMAKIHRPNMRHVATMLAGACAAAFISHLFIHGGL